MFVNTLFGFESLNKNIISFYKCHNSNKVCLEFIDLASTYNSYTPHLDENLQRLNGFLFRKSMEDMFFIVETNEFGYLTKHLKSTGTLYYMNFETKDENVFDPKHNVIPVMKVIIKGNTNLTLVHPGLKLICL